MPSYAEVEAVVMGLTRCDCRCSPTEDVPSDHSTIWLYDHLATFAIPYQQVLYSFICGVLQ